jgi:hypothetical protein
MNILPLLVGNRVLKFRPGSLSLGVKRQGREADHSSLSSAEVHFPNTPSWRCDQSKKSTGTIFDWLPITIPFVVIFSPCRKTQGYRSHSRKLQGEHKMAISYESAIHEHPVRTQRRSVNGEIVYKN